MRILLDTNILLWVLGDRRRLDPPTLGTIESDENDVLFSAASVWEIAIKAGLRRYDFGVRPNELIDAAIGAGFIELPVRSTVAARVADLPLIHRDPFDRLLIAQAVAEPAVLYTADAQLVAYSDLVRQVGAR
jgi:PIN domain nuclease of toxin-antitoxin system